jgi:hypothetical protein
LLRTRRSLPPPLIWRASPLAVRVSQFMKPCPVLILRWVIFWDAFIIHDVSGSGSIPNFWWWIVIMQTDIGVDIRSSECSLNSDIRFGRVNRLHLPGRRVGESSRRLNLSEISVACSAWHLSLAGSFLGWRRRGRNFQNYTTLKPRTAWFPHVLVFLSSSLCSFLEPPATIPVLGPHILFTFRTFQKQLYMSLWNTFFKFSRNFELILHVSLFLTHNSLSPAVCVKLLQILYKTSKHKKGEVYSNFLLQPKLSLIIIV